MIELSNKTVFTLAASLLVTVDLYAPIGGVMSRIGRMSPMSDKRDPNAPADVSATLDSPGAPTATLEALTVDGEACIALLREEQAAARAMREAVRRIAAVLAA